MQALQEGLFQIKDKVLLEIFLKWVWTSANFYEAPWLNQDTKGVPDKVKIGSLTQNLSILGKLIFLTQSVARVQLVLNPFAFQFLGSG